MCIAAIINAPVTLDYLQQMEDSNPHGGGVAWACKKSKSVRFKRGLTAKQIYAMQDTMSYPYLLHFRWATHGDKVPELTHPFPLGPRALMGELEGDAQSVIIHNGVWNKYDEWTDVIPLPKTLWKHVSDTAVLAYLMGANPNYKKHLPPKVPWAVALAEWQGKQMAVTKFGHSWVNHGGNEYSNLQWLHTNSWLSYSSGKGSGSYVYSKGYPMSDWKDWGEKDWDTYFEARYGQRYRSTYTTPEADRKAREEREAREARRVKAREKLAQMRTRKKGVGANGVQEWYDWERPDGEAVQPTHTPLSTDWEPDDLISEDPSEVNEYLAKRKVG